MPGSDGLHRFAGTPPAATMSLSDGPIGHVFSALALPGLPAHGTLMLAFTVGVFALFIWDRLPIASVCLGILVLLPLVFIAFPLEVDGKPVAPGRFFGGFGHPALIAISALMVIGHSLVVTGALEPVARRVASLTAQRPRLALGAVLLGALLVSGFVNDTPLVVLLIPLLLASTQRAGASPAGMLMPMNFAVLIGGMSTTIGTSTNLIVVSIAERSGLPRLGVLHFYPLVMAAAVPALLYLWLVAPRLLRSVPTRAETGSQDAFDAELHIAAGSRFEGKPLAEAVGATGDRLRVIGVRDAAGRMRRPRAQATLQAGDRLAVQETAADLKEFEDVLASPLHAVAEEQLRSEPAHGEAAGPAATPADDDEAATRDAVVARLITTPQSPLVGRTVRDERLAARYGLVVVGLRPGRNARGRLGADVPDRRVADGDVLLVQGTADALQEAQRDGIGLLLDARHALPRVRKAGVALATMAGVVLLSATKLLPIEVAALGGVLVLLTTGTLNWREAGCALSVKVALLVAASLALGDALSLTGGTGWLAGRLVDTAGSLSPAWMLVLVMGLMGVLTNFVSNNAAAAIGTPLAFELARRLGVPPEPYVLAVLFGCNLCYATPMGYQTNLLVMNAGGYRFGDFVRVGGPLFFIVGGALSALLVWRYGL